MGDKMKFDFLVKSEYDKRINDMIVEANPNVSIYNIRFIMFISDIQCRTRAFIHPKSKNIGVLLTDDIKTLTKSISHEYIHLCIIELEDLESSRDFDNIHEKVGL